MKNLIVVDIQPEYAKCFGYNLWVETVKKIKKAKRVCFYYVDFNCESPSFRNEDSEEYTGIVNYLYEAGLSDRMYEKITFVPKTYGFLRNQMDVGIDDDLIVKQLKLMLKHKVSDSYQLFDNYTHYESGVKRQLTLLKNAEQDVTMHDLFVPSFDTDILSQFQGAELIGGGRNECLAEMSLFMQAINVRHKIVEELTY